MRRVGKTRAIAATVGGALIAGALAAAPAHAEADPGATATKKSKGATTVTRTATGTTVANEQLPSLTATCPRHSTVVGGGFSSGLVAAGASRGPS